MGMVKATGATRAAALGLAVAALAGCASTPAPVARGPAAAAPHARLPDFSEGAPAIADRSAGLQCVPFARVHSGIEIYGDAHTWWTQAAGRYPRSSQPAPGSVLVIRGFNTASRGHVAVVRRVESSRLLFVDHANWLNAGEVSVRVPVIDVSPGNDWSQIRVWHVPGGHWGGRIYEAEGFIHPFELRLALG